MLDIDLDILLSGLLVQAQTATIFLPGGETPPESLAGEVVGVGVDGTTIVVTNIATGPSDVPFSRAYCRIFSLLQSSNR